LPSIPDILLHCRGPPLGFRMILSYILPALLLYRQESLRER